MFDGEDLKTDIELSFEDSIKESGVKMEIKV